MQQGTVSFPDKAADARHPNLAQAELFATQAAVSRPCGLERVRVLLVAAVDLADDLSGRLPFPASCSRSPLSTA